MGGAELLMATMAATKTKTIMIIKIITISTKGTVSIFNEAKMQKHMQSLFDIKKTQLELVMDRGYYLPAEEAPILSMNLKEFITYVKDLADPERTGTVGLSKARASLARIYTNAPPESDTPHTKTMLVYYGGKTNSSQKLISADVIRAFIGKTQTYRVTEAILIVDSPISSTGNEDLSALRQTQWDVFYDDELAYNPSRHVDVPLHVRLPPEEAVAVMAAMRVKPSQILIMRKSDPIAKYYGWVPGDLIRITRSDIGVSVLAPITIAYRIVTE